jgi:hypothetical protein
MQSFKFALLSLKGRLAAVACGLVCCVGSLAVVVLVFASASGELDPLLAKAKAAPSASAPPSAVASKDLVKRPPG